MKDNLDSAETSGKETAAAITALDGDPALVQEELKAVNANHDSLMDQLKDKQSQLEQAIGQGLELQDKLDEIEAWTAVLRVIKRNWNVQRAILNQFSRRLSSMDT